MIVNVSGGEAKKSPSARMMTHVCQHSQQIMHLILEAVSNSSGFLLEDKLEVLLQPYTEAEGTLVRIDNIFSVSLYIAFCYYFMLTIYFTAEVNNILFI